MSRGQAKRFAPPSWPGGGLGAGLPLRRAGALLKLGYRCNCGCVFCHSSPHRGLDLGTAEAKARIALAAASGVERVVLSGGEPTLRPDIVELIGEISALGLLPGMVSNGRMLAYRGLREALGQAGLGQLYLSLHSHRAETHDALVRAEAHGQTVRAARWAAAQGELDLIVNAVVTRWNLGDLQGLGRLVMRIAREGGRRGPGRSSVKLKLSFVEPEGEALGRFESLVPTYTEAAAALARLFEELSGPAAESGVDLRVDGFPPCLFPGARERTSDLFSEGFAYLAEAFEDRLHPIDDLAKARGRPCRGCSEDGCPGIFRTYLERRGDGELAPVLGPRGSSVDFELLGEAGPLRPRRCPCLTRRWPHPDLRRELLLLAGGRAQLCRSSATDFTEAELGRILRLWGQAYRARDPLGQAEDFGTALEKLRLAAACEGCPHRGACGGIWVPERRDVMAEGERALGEWLRGLGGRVLDIGCGLAAYLLPLGAAVAEGRLELYLLDPDPGAAQALARAGVPHQFLQCGAEELPIGAGPFDQVIALRSYSHFEDLDRALGAIARELEPGGRFTLVGDSPIALVRQRAAAQRDRQREDLALEHFRNHGPLEAWDLIKDHPFDLLRIEGPDPRGTNLWWLELVRRP
ncbi:MAG: radical SAM protein [Polyangia bacterium]|jgi:SAM-dependent methyltransferase|nr:radical SAM protein [Polyangia bacterium]